MTAVTLLSHLASFPFLRARILLCILVNYFDVEWRPAGALVMLFPPSFPLIVALCFLMPMAFASFCRVEK